MVDNVGLATAEPTNGSQGILQGDTDHVDIIHLQGRQEKFYSVK